eukprot:6226004-Alexandrium_andersonii.AAC.1
MSASGASCRARGSQRLFAKPVGGTANCSGCVPHRGWPCPAPKAHVIEAVPIGLRVCSAGHTMTTM